MSGSAVAVTPTYPRADGSTPDHLQRAAARLTRQAADDIAWILVGDHYPDDEWQRLREMLTRIFSGPLVFLNTARAVREIAALHPKNRWTAGGMDARLLGWQAASDAGFEYCLWLDDDEEWHDDHATTVINALRQYPQCELSFSAANYGSIILPRRYLSAASASAYAPDVVPLPGDTVSSTLCVRRGRALELMLRVWREHTHAVYTSPHTLLPNEDGTFLQACREQGIKTVFAAKVTVTKRTQEGAMLR